eukprot:3322089-Alexandrium_andersonii.AAC.1
MVAGLLAALGSRAGRQMLDSLACRRVDSHCDCESNRGAFKSLASRTSDGCSQTCESNAC